MAASAFVITRSGRKFTTPDEVVESFQEIHTALQDHDPKAVRVLVDLRPARGRNDAEFESALAPERRVMLSRYPQCAFLVRTSVGRLQIERYLRADGFVPRVFADEEEAKEWLEA